MLEITLKVVGVAKVSTGWASVSARATKDRTVARWVVALGTVLGYCLPFAKTYLWFGTTLKKDATTGAVLRKTTVLAQTTSCRILVAVHLAAAKYGVLFLLVDFGTQ